MSTTGHLSELESLRAQVADLSRALAERDQSMRAQSHHLEEKMQDLREQSHLLRTIIEGTAAETGDEFFASLVTHLTSTLHVQYAVISEVFEGRLTKIRTLAVSAGGTLVDNFEYELTHTPCATALTQTFTCFDRDVQATFPQCQRLADLGAESYCGVPLRTKGGAVIGLLVVMDTKPLQHGDYLQSLLEVLTPRVVVEFERKRAEQERAQALADLHNVMETVPDVMFTLDVQGNLVKWNRRLGDVTGYSPEELLNKPALAFVPLEEQARTATAIQRAFTDGYAELDGHLLTKEHHLIPYHWTGALLKNPHGESIGITGIGRDVSDKKQAEEELRQQRCHLVDAQRLAHLGSWDWDVDTGEVEWSDEQFRIFGYEPGAIVVTYDTFLASLHPDDHDPVLAAINDTLLGKRPYDVEYRIVRPDGEIRSIHARGDVHRDATGHPLSMAGTVLDITERTQVEAALRNSEERWHLAVRGSNDGIWDWNIQSGDIFFSPRWKAMRGFEDHEIENHIDEWRSRIHPDDLDRVLQSVDAYLAKQAPEFCEEYRAQRKDGSYIWILDRGVALWADNGTPTRMAGSESDITERKRAEEALCESEQRLGAILKNSPNMIFLKDLDGRYLYANKVFSDRLHLDPQVVIGKTDADLFEPDQARIFRRNDRQVVQEGMACSFEEIALHADGQRTSIVVKFPLKDSAGQIYATGGVVTDITVRKRAEDAIREAELRYRTIFEQAGAGVAQVESHTGQFVQVNRQYCEILGLTEAEMLGNTVGAITHPDDLERDLESMQRLLSGETSSFTMEKRYVRKDGSIVWVNLNVAPLWRPGEMPVHHIAIAQDITERKRAEESLRQSEERYRSLVDNAPIGIFVNETGRFVYANREMQRILKASSAEQLIGMPVLERIAPEFHTVAKDRIYELMKGQPVPSSDEQFVRLDGSRVDVAVTAIPTSFDGVPVMQVLVLDITERMQAEEALRRSHAFLRQVIDIDPNFIFAKDREGRFRLVNKAVADAYGTTVDQLIGKTDADFNTNPDEIDFFRLMDLKVMDSLQEQFIFEEAITDSTGKTRWLQTVKRPILDEQGRAIMILGAAADITDRKRIEEALRQGERDLRAAVEERERISQDLHDGILQSLFAVGLTLETAKSMMSPRNRKTSGPPIDQAIDQLNRVMHEIRNFIAGLGSDLLKGKDLPTALQHMLESLTQHHATRVRLAVEDRATQALSAEQSLHLLLVIQEAVSNCIRHGRAQEATVSLKMLKQGVRVSIRDNGSGFDPKAVRRTGHGLVNMAARAQKIGGRFTVFSKINEGTRVVLDLPKEASYARR